MTFSNCLYACTQRFRTNGAALHFSLLRKKNYSENLCFLSVRSNLYCLKRMNLGQDGDLSNRRVKWVSIDGRLCTIKLNLTKINYHVINHHVIVE
jgi:hypothetical protein